VQTYPAGDVAAAVRRANATPYGLAAAVAGRNLGAAVAVANALQAGTVWINTHGLFDPSAPYGGTKASGSGKEYGEAGLRAYCEEKTVMLALPPAGAAVE
jgi:p-cumic aldehyde dehydrogenase